MPQFCHARLRSAVRGELRRGRPAFARRSEASFGAAGPGTRVAPRRVMRLALTFSLLLFLITAQLAAAQTPAAAPKEPPPLWDAQLGASFVGTSGNTDTSSIGADFAAHRRGLVWQLESTATAVRVSTNDVKTAERYLGQLQGKRKLTPIIGLVAGEKLERDQFSGIDFRSI